MATGHSMTPARLMGAMSRKRDRQFVVHEPSRARLRRVFCSPQAGSFGRDFGESRNGRPGSRGSRGESRAPEARGLPEGTARDNRGPPMAGRTKKKGSLRRRAMVESAATDSFCNFCRNSRGTQFQVVKTADTSSVKRRPLGQSAIERSPGSLRSLRFASTSTRWW